MKFVVLFVVCCVALVAANEQEEQQEFKDYVEEMVKEHEITCDNHEQACVKWLSEELAFYKADHLKDFALPACNNIMHQYLCEGKNEGEAFADLYKQVAEYEKEFYDKLGLSL